MVDTYCEQMIVAGFMPTQVEGNKQFPIQPVKLPDFLHGRKRRKRKPRFKVPRPRYQQQASVAEKQQSMAAIVREASGTGPRAVPRPLVVTVLDEKSEPLGFGSLVGGHLLTCGHLDGAVSILNKGKNIPLGAMEKHPKLDLAMYKVSGPSARMSSIRAFAPGRGAVLLGKRSVPSTMRENGEHTGRFQPGSSGAPLVQRNLIMGLHVGAEKGKQIFVPFSQEVVDWLKQQVSH
jgi:hypothetical protein